MLPFLQLAPLLFKQNVGRQLLDRIPEPEELVVTDGGDAVAQYDQVMSTKLAINYAIGVESVYRARQKSSGGSALDVACGPGHMSLSMLNHLALDGLTGLDLSEPMVATATKNAREQGFQRASFVSGDATDLPFEDSQFDLTTMVDAAHHMPTIDHVSEALAEMDRVTQEDGLVFLMDLVRLRTESITKRYVSVLGADYEQRGLESFLQQFHDSMFAAWTADEIMSAIPKTTARNWFLLIPRGVPFAQLLFGVPKSQTNVFLRSGAPWGHSLPLRSEEVLEYKLARFGVSFAQKKTPQMN